MEESLADSTRCWNEFCFLNYIQLQINNLKDAPCDCSGFKIKTKIDIKSLNESLDI